MNLISLMCDFTRVSTIRRKTGFQKKNPFSKKNL